MTTTVAAGQTSASTGFLDAANAIGGKRSLGVATNPLVSMPAGQSATFAVDASSGYADIVHSQTAVRSVYAIDWSGTLASSPYDLATALGTASYSTYSFEVDFNILQFVGSSLALEMDVYTQGGGTAIYAATYGPATGPGTATLAYLNSTGGTPDPSRVIGFQLRTTMPTGTGTVSSLTFQEVQAVPEPGVGALVVIAGIAAVVSRTRRVPERR